MIVRALAGDGDVVDVALAKSGAGDAHEARLLLELRNRFRPDIAHGGAQAPGELVHDRRRRTAIGRLPFRLVLALENAVYRALTSSEWHFFSIHE
jgi:hypothetical protein